MKLIKISDIVAEKDYMMRESLDKDLVNQYRENWESIKGVAPIVVFDTPGGLILADGFHRLAAARSLGNIAILADVREGLAEDAYAHACVANLKHGKPLKKSERDHAINELIKTRVTWSNQLIADGAGVHKDTIRLRRQALELKNEIEHQEAREGKDGKTYKTGDEISSPDKSEEELKQERLEREFNDWFNSIVIHDDALEIMKGLDKKYDLIIVDPPYGITTESWDLKNKHELLAFTRRWITQALGCLKDSGRMFIFWSRRYMFDLKPLFDEIEALGAFYPIQFGGMIVWHFRNVGSMPDSTKRYKLSWEPIFYYYGDNAPPLNFTRTEISGKEWKGEEQWDVWTYAIPQSNFGDKRIHPTQKPLDLYQQIISSASQAGDNILDPFAGSGTTAHAALLTGRNATLIEQDENYIQAIRNRLKPVWEAKNESG